MLVQLVWFKYHVFVLLLVACALCQRVDETGECEEGDMYFDLNDCNSYFQCLNGAVLKKKCPEGSYFDAACQVCVIDVIGVCSSPYQICREGEIRADPENCAGYLKCINGRLEHLKCDNGSYYSSTWKTCVVDANGICSNKPQKCIEGANQEDPKNCAGYLKCINGTLVSLKCDNGSYFSSVWNTCVIDDTGVCEQTSIKCVDGELLKDTKDCAGYLKCINGNLVEMKCESGYYFNATLKACLIDKNGLCSHDSEQCADGEVLENPADCAGYLECINGTLVEMQCGNGDYFDSTLKICLVDENGICTHTPEKCSNSQVLEDPADCSAYLECINGILLKDQCGNGSYFNAMLNICVIDEENICVPGKCIEGKVVEDPENCAGYVECLNGTLVKIKCGNGDYFNSTLNFCVIDENGFCSHTPELCIEGKVEEDPEDCSAYLKCINGTLVKVKCDNGSYFDTTLEICVIDENGSCSPGKCSEGDVIEDPEDCAGYLECINGTLEKMKCTNGNYFNSTLKVCLVDEYGFCSHTPEQCTEGKVEKDPEDCSAYLKCLNGTLVKVKCDNGSYFDTTLEICVIDENGSCSPEKCSEGDAVDDPEDCAGYLECINGTLVEMKCGNGSYFNTALHICSIDELRVCSPVANKCVNEEVSVDPEDCSGFLQCINGELVKNVCSTGSYFDAALGSCVVDTEGKCSPTKNNCIDGELKADTVDCRSYQECIDGTFVAQTCQSGSYFDKSIKACVVDENFVCLPPAKVNSCPMTY